MPSITTLTGNCIPNNYFCGLQSVKAAKDAFEHWSMGLTGKQRGVILQKWYQLMCDKESQLAELLTLEQVTTSHLALCNFRTMGEPFYSALQR